MIGQELDVLELGEDAAKCLKGENKNSPATRMSLVAGRAYRGRWRARSEAFWKAARQARRGSVAEARERLYVRG